MPNLFRHFAINCDDVKRARAFYTGVFGWTTQSWGPPDFLQIATEPGGPVQGALQKRREIVPGKPLFGFECTFGVDDIEAIERAVLDHGGKVVMPKVAIPTVGTLLFFEDTEGNIAGAMQYEKR